VPELPEVQAHAERLTNKYTASVLEQFQALRFTALKTAVPKPDEAYGHALERVDRRGKYLLAHFGPRVFIVHLMQGGRLLEDTKQSAKPRNGQARWRFRDGRAWLLTEAGTERRAGVWCAYSGLLFTEPPLDRLGPEALDVSTEELAERLAARSTRLHSFLRDQGAIAGLGRRLANEICHRAKQSPFAGTGKLGQPAVAQIVEAIHACVDEGLSYERQRDDMSASADRPGNVHHRTGEPCPVCGDTVREVSYSSYTVNYCPTCQTGGKVLADNTTSRFLK
jgi:formamidopyrimidine-DNA glycosylase